MLNPPDWLKVPHVSTGVCPLQSATASAAERAGRRCSAATVVAASVGIAAGASSISVEPSQYRARLGRRLRCTGSKAAVRGARDFDACGRHMSLLQRLVVLRRVAHRNARMLIARDQQGRSGYAADERQRRVLQGAVWAFPGWLAEAVLRRKRIQVCCQDFARPVDTGLLSGRRTKALIAADDSGALYTAARASGDKQIAGGDAATGARSVERTHQIVVIMARVVVVNEIRKDFAVGGRTAWVRIHDDVVRSRWCQISPQSLTPPRIAR